MVKVTHPDRVIFPEPGVTKGDIVAHYERVGAAMLEFVDGRPLTLQRFPKGITEKGFMQKNAAKHFPESIERYPVDKRDGGVTDYPVIHQAEDLAYLANQGTVTFHMWTSTAADPDHPDYLVMDLDPEADDVDGVRFATTAVRDVLAEFGLEGFVVATGSKGFHVWVPLDGRHTVDEVAVASRAVAGLVSERHPERMTTEFLKKNRTGRVFVDWLRNTGIATIVVPFSLRPRPTAPVAVPVRWSEIDTATPDGWTINDLGDRLDVDYAIAAQSLPLDDILAAARDAGVDLDTPHDRFGRT